MRAGLTSLYVLVMSVALGAQGGAVPTPTPTDKRMVSVGGAEIYVESFGTGEPLLLLHGFGGCRTAWDPFIDGLSKRFTVIVPHLRGHGRSTNSSSGFTFRQSGRDIVAVLDALKIRSVRAMGISAGGMTLLHVATAHRDRIEAMVLIGAAHYFPAQAREIMRGAAEGLPPDVLGFFRRCATRGDSQVTDLVKTFASFKDSYDDMNFTAPYLGTIQARTLIVHGDRDEFFPVEIPTEMYRSIPNSELWIVPGGDHVPIYGARAPTFADLTVAFLERGSPAPEKER